MRSLIQIRVGIVAVMVLSLLAAAGCGGDDSTGTATSSTGTVSTATAKATQTTATVTAAAPDATEAPAASSNPPASDPAPAESQAPLQIIAQIASPESVSPGAPVTISCEVKGEASSVWVEISKKMDSSFSTVTYPLTKGATSAGVTTWSASIPAPAVAGLFAFSTFATGANGITVQNELGQGPYDGPSVYFSVQ